MSIDITNHQRNVNQNLNEISPHTFRMAIVKKQGPTVWNFAQC